MRHYRRLAEVPRRQGRWVAVGTFDGVHLGHQGLLAEARRRGGPGQSLVLTFDPHPLEIVRPFEAPPLLLDTPERLRAIAASGVDACLVLPFTRRLAATPAEEFLERFVVGGLAPRGLVVGYNFTFGRGGRGDTGLLERWAEAGRFELSVVGPISAGGAPVSSTRVRQLLAAGDVATARSLLGRPHRLTGTVVPGRRVGRRLGFPTANLAVSGRLCLPSVGVYAARAHVDPFGGEPDSGSEPAGWPAVVNVGRRPTFGPGPMTVEAHLIDWSGELYGRRVALELVDRLRDERRFSGPSELQAQLAADVFAARGRLAVH